MREKLPAHKYRVTTQLPSVFDPKEMIEVTIGYRCPRCKTVLKLEKETTTKCPGCNLEITMRGNALNCEGDA